MYVAQQQAVEGLALLNRTQERSGLSAVAGARQLDVLVMRALVRVEQKWKASHAFTTIDTHFDAIEPAGVGSCRSGPAHLHAFGLKEQLQGIGNVPMILHNKDTHALKA
jgi:hypothetical protein